MNAGHLLDLVGKIYDAAVDSSRWPIFLESFSQAVGTGGTAIFMHDFSNSHATVDGNASLIAAHVRFDPAFLQSLTEYYNTVNVWVQNEHRLAEGVAVTGSMLYPVSALESTEWYGDWLRPQGYFHAIGGIVLRNGPLAVKFTSLRPRRKGDFSPAHLALYEQLIPHLRRACALHQHFARLSVQRDAGLHVLDALQVGVALVDREGRALFVNRAAKSIAAHHDGFSIDAHGVIGAGIASETARLRQLIGAAVATTRRAGSAAGGSIRLTRQGDSQPLSVMVSPLPPRALQEQFELGPVPAAFVSINDPGQTIGTPSTALQKLYMLTPAEAELAAAIGNGQRLADYAQRRKVTRNTVASQLKCVLAKTGARRQSELVRLLLTSASSFRVPGDTGVQEQ